MGTTHVAQPGRNKKPRFKRILLSILIGIAVLALAVFTAFQVSPWPAALLIRYQFTENAEQVNKALEKHVPPGISSILDEQYDSNDGDAFLDVYFPSAIADTKETLPAVVWVHGGGWVSGNKEQVSSYCKILAGKGYTVISVDYTLAPEKKYPTPLRQTNAALGYLTKHAERLHINPSQFILAGDSGGSSIVAQVANLISVPSYAVALGIEPAISRTRLAALLLFCGAYDARNIKTTGIFGKFNKAVLWSYSGERDYLTNPEFATLNLVEYVTASFPPSFISAGNGDPLLSQSHSLARTLGNLGVPVDTLFFPADHTPAEPHEYQFNLDTAAGRLALARTVEFLAGLRAGFKLDKQN